MIIFALSPVKTDCLLLLLVLQHLQCHCSIRVMQNKRQIMQITVGQNREESIRLIVSRTETVQIEFQQNNQICEGKLFLRHHMKGIWNS